MAHGSNPCLQTLYDDERWAVCLLPFGVEHSHHDGNVQQIVEAGNAEWLAERGCFDCRDVTAEDDPDRFACSNCDRRF